MIPGSSHFLSLPNLATDPWALYASDLLRPQAIRVTATSIETLFSFSIPEFHASTAATGLPSSASFVTQKAQNRRVAQLNPKKDDSALKPNSKILNSGTNLRTHKKSCVSSRQTGSNSQVVAPTHPTPHLPQQLQKRKATVLNPKKGDSVPTPKRASTLNSAIPTTNGTSAGGLGSLQTRESFFSFSPLGSDLSAALSGARPQGEVVSPTFDSFLSNPFSDPRQMESGDPLRMESRGHSLHQIYKSRLAPLMELDVSN